jgi:hypothetical protein
MWQDDCGKGPTAEHVNDYQFPLSFYVVFIILLRNTERGGGGISILSNQLIFSFLSLKTLGYFVETSYCIVLRKQECIQRSYYEFLHSSDVY